MLNPFKKETIYLRLFENRIELRYLEKDRTISRTSQEPFSNERSLIATISVAQKFIREALPEIRPLKFLQPTLIVLLQPMEKVEGGISEVETMMFNDLVLGIGGRYAFIHPAPERLSDEEVTRITAAARKIHFMSILRMGLFGG